jgi:surface protein
VSAVKDMTRAFSKNRGAKGVQFKNGNLEVDSFDASGLAKWKTGSVTALVSTFDGAGTTAGFKYVDLGNWDVSRVTNMAGTFSCAANFAGVGLTKWDIGRVTNMANTFNGANGITSCNKRMIADKWQKTYDAGSGVWSVHTAFAPTNSDWGVEECPVRDLFDPVRVCLVRVCLCGNA